MKYFANVHNADELRKAYRQHVINMHPDRGGNEEEFKAMQAEFEQLKKQYQNGTAYTYESRHTETAEERARREAEEAREREEWERWEAEEKARREQEEREKAERIRKAQEVSRAAVRAWAGILERVSVDKTGEKARYYRFTDKKEAAAFVATTKRNIKAVINHYFPGLKVSVKISGEIWKEKFIISWEDGPSVKQLRDTCKELAYFVPSYYEPDPYADYGDYKTREGSAPWREAYGQALGDIDDFETVRTLSEEGKEQAEEFAARYFKNWNSEAMNGEKLSATFGEFAAYMRATDRKDGICAKWNNYANNYGEDEGIIYYSVIRDDVAENAPVSVSEEEKAARRAAKFAPRYGEALRKLRDLTGVGSTDKDGDPVCFFTGDRNSRRRLTIAEAVERLEQGEAVSFGTEHKGEDGSSWYWGKYAGGYKTQDKRAEKFAAAGLTIRGHVSPQSFISLHGIAPEFAAAIRADLQDIERQRQQWEQEQTAKASEKTDNGKKAAKTDNSKQESKQADSDRDGVDMTAAPAEGLRLVETAEGVAVVADDWKTTYFNKRYIKAHGAHWNKERKQWEATEPQDVDALRAWFFFHGKPTDQGATIDDVTTEEERDTATASAPDDLSPVLQAFADVLRIFADIMQQAKQWEGVTIPAATLARWKQEAEDGTKTAAARLCEVCACLASLTPDSRKDFDALGAIFWSLSEQIRNGYDPDTLQAATDYARAQLFDLIDRTQNENQARAVREANEQRKAA